MGSGGAATGGPLAPSTVYSGAPSLNGGAVVVEDPGATVSNDLDNYDDEPVASIADPLEPWNRFWFKFNDIFFIHVAKPVYEGWTWLTPRFVQTGLGNLFHNVLFPTRFVNSILQFRFMEAGVEFSRFMMNMMGSAGLVDLASSKKTIVPVDPSGEDFGQTLGRWGFGQGFYLVWPFIGPSSLRDTIGRVGDVFTDPIFYVNPWPYSTGTEVVFRLNALGDVLPAYDDLSSISIDPYIAMREAYASLRAAQVAR
ncbi:MAG: VacJ family lipoprotein [Desulfovibrio sp.]|nr:VacJ family lipoprotein [Desulfovibrio sp.]